MTVRELYEKVHKGEIVSDIGIQREIIYDTEKQRMVIDSIVNDIPLPAFYLWNNTDIPEGEYYKYEVLDGKQRIEAIKNFYDSQMEYNGLSWKKTSQPIQEKINNTELCVIVCSGTEEHKREIFSRINTLGVPLKRFEVLNGLYNGEYLEGLRDFVVKEKSVSKIFGSDTRGEVSYKMLEYLKTIRGFQNINDYVKDRSSDGFGASYNKESDQDLIAQHLRFVYAIFDKPKANADIYFRLSLKYLREKGIWLENKDKINRDLAEYFKSDELKLYPEKKAEHIEEICLAAVEGITVDRRRFFTKEQKQELLEKQPADTIKAGKYMCDKCKQHFYPDELQVDHIKPWSKGGPTELSNAALLCSRCNVKKLDK